MCPHRESGRLRAGQNAGRQMDHRGREEPPARLSISRRGGIRLLPGICWYPDKGMAVMAMNQDGTADNEFYSSLTEEIILSGAFLFLAEAQFRGRKRL